MFPKEASLLDFQEKKTEYEMLEDLSVSFFGSHNNGTKEPTPQTDPMVNKTFILPWTQCPWSLKLTALCDHHQMHDNHLCHLTFQITTYMSLITPDNPLYPHNHPHYPPPHVHGQ